jgi:hypothetical protein
LHHGKRQNLKNIQAGGPNSKDRVISIRADSGPFRTDRWSKEPKNRKGDLKNALV